jgi:hypothetical protein
MVKSVIEATKSEDADPFSSRGSKSMVGHLGSLFNIYGRTKTASDPTSYSCMSPFSPK